MAFRRLRRLVCPYAFTLPEVVVSLVIISISAALLLSAVSISSGFVTRAADLCAQLDSSMSSLYKGDTESLTLKPPVRIEYSDGMEYENVDGRDGVELPWLKVYRVSLGNDITMYYYGGEYSEENGG